MSRTIAGIHAVRHALEAGEPLSELQIEKGKKHPRINELIHLARKAKVRVSFAPKEALDRLSEGVPHQGVVAKTAARRAMQFNDWLASLAMDASPLVLLLDQITDPHNLGACLRTAEAAGCAGVIMPKDHAAAVHSPVVAKAASGALSRLPLLAVTNMARAMAALKDKGFWLFGLAGEVESSLFEADLTSPVALVMGAEGKGLRRLVRDRCDRLVSIPMAGEMESLNVSVATGIALFEALRQRSGR